MNALEQRFAEAESALKAHVERNLQLADANGWVVCLKSRCNPETFLIVSPNLTKPGIWNVTRFIDVGPTGHHEFASREQAIRAASGESFSDKVAGPAYHSPGEFIVEP